MRAHYRERFAITIINAVLKRFAARDIIDGKQPTKAAPKGWINDRGIGGGDGGSLTSRIFNGFRLRNSLYPRFSPRYQTFADWSLRSLHIAKQSMEAFKASSGVSTFVAFL